MELLRWKHCLAAVLLAFVAVTSAYNAGARITEGTEAATGEFPFMVALYMNVSDEIKFHCGAALLSTHYAVTAGHCVEGWYANRFSIVAGTVDLENYDSTAVEAQVEEYALHDIFHFELGTAIPTNDIALLKLSGPGMSGPGLGTVPTSGQDDEVPVGSVCTVLGWGATESSGPVVSRLRKTDVLVQNQTYCFESFGALFRPGMMCAGWAAGGADACQGDSGGPLLCDGVLHGLVSWGDGCGEPLKFGVYTRVAVFADWLEKHNFVFGYPQQRELV